jgi:hypothetical protein
LTFHSARLISSAGQEGQHQPLNISPAKIERKIKMFQFTNSVKAMIDKAQAGKLLLAAIEYRQAGNHHFNENIDFGGRIKGMIKRGELLTDKEKIELADYMLEYQTDYDELAKTYLQMIDSAARKA